jgi:hypothetical protein
LAVEEVQDLLCLSLKWPQRLQRTEAWKSWTEAAVLNQAAGRRDEPELARYGQGTARILRG